MMTGLLFCVPVCRFYPKDSAMSIRCHFRIVSGE